MLTNGYCTLSEFKDWMTSSGQSLSDDVGDDSVIETIIESTSRFIDGECARRFWKNSVDETRYYAATESGYCRVDDLVSVTTIYTDYGSRDYLEVWSSGDFDLWPYNAALDGRPYLQIIPSPASGHAFPSGVSRGVKVTGVFGYPSVPAQIKEATMMISLSTYKRRFGENLSSVSTITAGGIVITPQDVPALAWSKINPFRKRL